MTPRAKPRPVNRPELPWALRCDGTRPPWIWARFARRDDARDAMRKLCRCTECKVVFDRERKIRADATLAQVSPNDLWWLVGGYVRYALYRTSTAPATACDFVARYGRHFTRQQLQQIADEIETELRIAESNGGFVGHRCDHDTWWRAAGRAREIAGGKDRGNA
jgi:hypothetical protein